MAGAVSRGNSTLNFNVGVLGHVDSGKTSLSKALSTVASTASFDKNPQSRERGITLDLGFSSFCVDAPQHLNDNVAEHYDKLQFTLVDCPGHASLIRTIIGGSQIIDLMMLVVDATKGFQTQTAECLIIGEITCEKLILVLNKIDLLPEDKKSASIEKMTRRLQKTLEGTRFVGSPVIPIAAKPGGAEVEGAAVGVDLLMEMLKSYAYRPERDATGPFIFAVDHCFSIRGQGTVMTGTVLSGSVTVNDTVEIPSMKVTKKVKSMQMFKNPVNKAIQGDRLGICVTQFDPKLLERGLVSSPAALPTICAAIISIQKIPYYKGEIATRAKFHITMGHETVMGRITVFGWYGEKSEETQTAKSFNYERDYLYQDSLMALGQGSDNTQPSEQFALLEFEKHVTCAAHCLVIGSRLDMDIHSNTCRLAFHGYMLEVISDDKYRDTILPRILVYKNKSRQGVAERKQDEYSIICRDLFKKESDMDMFNNLKVTLSTGEQGFIEGGFGTSGKFKVRIPGGLQTEADRILSSKGKKSKDKAAENSSDNSTSIKVILAFKRYVYDPKKRMIQR